MLFERVFVTTKPLNLHSDRLVTLVCGCTVVSRERNGERSNVAPFCHCQAMVASFQASVASCHNRLTQARSSNTLRACSVVSCSESVSYSSSAAVMACVTTIDNVRTHPYHSLKSPSIVAVTAGCLGPSAKPPATTTRAVETVLVQAEWYVPMYPCGMHVCVFDVDAGPERERARIMSTLRSGKIVFVAKLLKEIVNTRLDPSSEYPMQMRYIVMADKRVKVQARA